MAGVPEMIAEVQVEGTFPTAPSWSPCITRSRPKTAILSLALYGSFLPVPELGRFADDAER